MYFFPSPQYCESISIQFCDLCNIRYYCISVVPDILEGSCYFGCNLQYESHCYCSWWRISKSQILQNAFGKNNICMAFFKFSYIVYNFFDQFDKLFVAVKSATLCLRKTALMEKLVMISWFHTLKWSMWSKLNYYENFVKSW